MTRILFDRILFATDFSPASTVALPYATAIARHFGAKLYLAYVISPDAYDLIPVDEPLELCLSEEQIPQVIVFIMNPQNEESVYRAGAQGRQWAARFRLVNSE